MPARKTRVRQTLSRIYGQHRQGLFTLALAITHEPATAEDAVHDAFVRLLKHDRQPDGDPVAYVFAAVRNAALDQRKTRRLVELDGEAQGWIFVDDAPRPGEQAAAAEERQMVRHVLRELDDDDRTAVVLRIYAGLTFDQIARTLGEPLQTVAARYRRALQKIKDKLQPTAKP